VTPLVVRRNGRLHVGARVALVAVVALVAWYIPRYYEPFRVEQFSRVLVFAIAVLGLNLLTGFGGQISLGHSAFFGVGAYTTAILVAEHGWPHLATVAVAAVASFVVGLLCGIPALRIKGLYLALVTLALATVFPLLLRRFDTVTGGSQGKRVPKFSAPGWTGLANDQYRYWVTVAVAVAVFVLVRNLVHSRVGRALIAMRDNETAAEVIGVHLAVYKTATFGLSAAIAGVAGSLFAINESFIDSASFTVQRSITFLAAMVIGGAATIVGPVFGALFVELAPEVLSDQNRELSQVLYGALLIVLMFVMPGGVVGLYRSVKARVLEVQGSPEAAAR